MAQEVAVPTFPSPLASAGGCSGDGRGRPPHKY
jgi:hypothetical protein